MTDPATGFIKRCLSEVITGILLLREMSRCSGLWGWAERKKGLGEEEEEGEGIDGVSGRQVAALAFCSSCSSRGRRGSVLGSWIEVLPERGWGSRDAVMQRAHSVV